jgi:GTPase involved in cell partitioning and DNA repair
VDAYQTVRAELAKFDEKIVQKREIVLLTKNDTVSKEELNEKRVLLKRLNEAVYDVSIIDDASLKRWSDTLSQILGE